MAKLAKRYSTNELCAFKGVTPAYFRKNSEKLLNKWRKTDYIEVIKGPHSNSTTYYDVTPKDENELPKVLLESSSEVELTKNSEKQIELILKAVLIDRIVPIQSELSKVIGKGIGTVKNRVKEMKELGIKLPTPTVLETDYDEETGEIIEYERKDCYWFYYDTLLNGNIKKIIETSEVHNAFGKFYKQQIAYLKSIHGAKYDSNIGNGLANNFALKQLDKKFSFNSINRVAEWNVSEEFEKKICGKY
ncbi:hypothetical protein CN692_14250 [Bacillus sp. AFS002410]|uniref:hypothetical protein n=1 Tax=Bacillus sp. AFS002410 TaxID=2033481 RepID=UPI000BF0072B|nr:hypothetical protein [Bacillus sp. AFS002410]PEJ57056.1 hypothetical protein CN692_14250 [Bacillus sp. AFS002410]